MKPQGVASQFSAQINALDCFENGIQCKIYAKLNMQITGPMNPILDCLRPRLTMTAIGAVDLQGGGKLGYCWSKKDRCP